MHFFLIKENQLAWREHFELSSSGMAIVANVLREELMGRKIRGCAEQEASECSVEDLTN